MVRLLNTRAVSVILLLLAFGIWTAYFPVLVRALMLQNFTFDVGGALGGIATLAAAGIAWVAVQNQIRNEREGREAAAREAQAVRLEELREQIALARTFIAEVETISGSLVSGASTGGRLIAVSGSEADKSMDWLASLATDAMAAQAMTVPPLHCRRYAWWVVRKAQAFGESCKLTRSVPPTLDNHAFAISEFDLLMHTITRAKRHIQMRAMDVDERLLKLRGYLDGLD